MNNKLVINQKQIIEVKNIGQGVYSPLDGFLKKEDFLGVVSKMRLSNGLIWPIPIVLDISREGVKGIKGANKVALVDEGNKLVAFLKEPEIFSYDKDFLAQNVFKTLDQVHPGVKETYQMNDYLIGGQIELIDDSPVLVGPLFEKYNSTPQETKKFFQEKSWQTIAAFQTRNIPHRSHEAIQKHALEQMDGLFIQPVIGKKKAGDFEDELILKSYEVLINGYYPKERVHLGILPLRMRYAGPREAVLHALIRKNYGCTHMIVGRDHAGVGNYYGPYEAQEIFNQFLPEEMGINILKYDNFVFCRGCETFVSQKICPHSDEIKVFLSGTEIRELVKKKEPLPNEFVRKEVGDLVLSCSAPFVKE